MSVDTQIPVLPHGYSSTLSALSESFSFHSSPEAFITSRVLAFHQQNPTVADLRTPVRAKVLNRNVTVVSSYRHVQTILCTPGYSAALAYDELMAPFFPAPNLLLADSPVHGPMKKRWQGHMDNLVAKSKSHIGEITLSFLDIVRASSTIDLYDSMKTLSWRLIQGLFLEKDGKRTTSQETGADVEQLQEDLLRGQFSLFPVSINARFWRSPRSRGLQAMQKLQAIFKDLDSHPSVRCPFSASNSQGKEEIANHMLLFTSSLAVKALASLLTAFLLNIYVSPSSQTLRERIFGAPSMADQECILRSVLSETERLSPPVMGIMRKTLQDVQLPPSTDEQPPILIPKGWDVWLYFVGAGRDPATFGATGEIFDPNRHESGSEDQLANPGFAFGAGPKSCLGQTLVRDMAMTVAKVFLGLLDGQDGEMALLNSRREDIPAGVQGWLGWQADVKAEDWAKDMKQLPTQRPKKSVMVQFQRLHSKLGLEHTQDNTDEWYDALEHI